MVIRANFSLVRLLIIQVSWVSFNMKHWQVFSAVTNKPILSHQPLKSVSLFAQEGGKKSFCFQQFLDIMSILVSLYIKG